VAPGVNRVEGHHLSQNYTVVNGKVVDGPSFFGSNPAEVQQGPRKGLRTLAGENDLGIELVRLLDEQQQKVAIVDPTGYKEILTAASRKAALQGQPSGLSGSRMNAMQFDALMALMEEYARNVAAELAENRIAQINQRAFARRVEKRRGAQNSIGRRCREAARDLGRWTGVQLWRAHSRRRCGDCEAMGRAVRPTLKAGRRYTPSRNCACAQTDAGHPEYRRCA